MMENIDKFVEVIQEMIDFFEQFQILEKVKLEAVRDNDIIKLEECMKKEQAEILVLRGIERKQAQIQKELGFENATFREIIELVPLERKAELETMYNKLSNSLDIFKSTTEGIKKTIEINLYSIENAMQKLVNEKKHSNGKEALDGSNVSSKNHSFTSRKV